jgi:hypothetical protein
LIECGQHSLPVFCLGIALSMAGHLAVAQYGDGWAVQVATNLVGISLMFVVAWTLQHFTASASSRPGEAKHEAVGSLN